MASLSIFTLGPPHIELDHQPVTLERSKALALLVYLAVESGGHTRMGLATLFWPDYEPARSLAYLRRTLWEIKAAVGEGRLRLERDNVSLLEGEFDLDVHRFRSPLAECKTHGHAPGEVCPACLPLLEAAVEAYRGNFLSGFSLRDSAAFDEWQFFQAENLRQEQAGALQRLASGRLAAGDASGAGEAARRLLGSDPLQEAAHRLVIQAYLAAGQRSAALRQYQECVRMLETELGVKPEPETQALYAQLTAPLPLPAAAQEPVRPSFPTPSAPSPLPAPPVVLPHQPTPFIGRADELAGIARCLNEPDCRLLTLVGPGGIGKTRLAVEAAAGQAQTGAEGSAYFPHGIFFVPLAPLSAPDFLVLAIAEALRLSFRQEESPLSQLLNYLREKRLLLIMDNFEHLVAGAELLSSFLVGAPGIKILVTSRERLNLQEEWVFEVRGMSFPASPVGPGEESGVYEDFTAIRLFLQSARRARSGFIPQPEEWPAVVQICQLVEGVPLGIELAAAWVKMFPCPEIAREIERNRDFLATTLRGVPERHQSLRAVFEHSWNLLSSDEQHAYRMLSVMRGSFRREAAEAILTGGGRTASTPLSILAALVDKSMLRWGPTGANGHGLEARYEMHELLKQYAAEKLEASPAEREAAHRQHGLFYLRFLAEMQAGLEGAQQLEALEQIEMEIEDVRAAWNWGVQQGEVEALAGAGLALSLFLTVRSRTPEGVELFGLAARRLEELRAAAGRLDPQLEGLYIQALLEVGNFTGALGDYPSLLRIYGQALELLRGLESQATLAPHLRALYYIRLSFGRNWLPVEEVERIFKESVKTLRAQGDRWGEAMALLAMGEVAEYPLNEVPRARRLRQESLAIFEALGNPWGMVLCLNILANLIYGLGEYEESERLSQKSLALCKQLGDRWRTINCLLNLGQVVTALGDYERARGFYQEGLALAREAGNRFVLATLLDCLGYVENLLGEYPRAEAAFQESLAHYQEQADRRGTGMALQNLGDTARARSDLALARQRYLDALALLEEADMAWGVGICLKKLGSLECQKGDWDAARSYLRQALEVILPVERLPEVLEIFTIAAEIEIAAGRTEQAAAWLALSAHHPATAREARNRAAALYARLADALPPDRFAQARERVEQVPVSAMVQEVLQALQG